MSLFGELRRRRVFRASGLYVVGAVAMLQAGDVLLKALRLPDVALTVSAFIAVAGLPVVIVLAWLFELTPQGLRRQDLLDGEDARISASPHAMLAGGVGIGILVATVGLGAYGRWMPHDRDAMDRSLAVLPFANLSDDVENEYFSDGISEDILTKLATLPDLRVISRASVLRYKGTTKPIPEVARELGISMVVQGSVRRAGNRVRITVQLTRADTDEQLWGDTFDRDLVDIFALQTEIAERIVRELRLRIGAEEQARLAASATTDVEAYDLILRGRQYLYANYKSTAELITNTAAALALFRHALDRDDASAVALSWLSRGYGGHQGLPPHAREDSALTYARRAVAVDPRLAEARLALARAHVALDARDSARHHLDEAIRLSPNDAEALALRGRMAVREAGDYVAGVRDLRRATELDPGTAFHHAELALLYLSIDAHAAAERAYREAFERIAPHPARLACHLGVIAVARGDLGEAVRQAHRIVDLEPEATFGRNCAGNLLFRVGRDPGTTRAWLEEAYAADAPTYNEFPLVVLRARAGEAEAAERLIAAIDSVSRADRAPHLPASHGWRVQLAAFRGDYAEAAERIHAAVRDGRLASVPNLRLSLGEAAGDPAIAAALDSMSAAAARVRARLAAEGLL